MSVPKFCLLYFPDENVTSVEYSDVIRGEHKKVEYVVNSAEDLNQEEGYVEVTLPSRSRKGPSQTLAAKILLFGDVYRDLILKKEAFKKGAWVPGQSTSCKGGQAAQIKEPLNKVAARKAADVMVEHLKTSILTTQRPPAPSTYNSQDSDETDVDTDLDLFDNSQRWPRKRKAIRIESDEDEVPIEEERVDEEERRHIRYTLLDERTANALKELPSVLSRIQETLESMQNQSVSSSPSVTSEECQLVATPQMMTIGGSDVKVDKRLYDRLNKSRVSLFVQDLATLVFGKECLAKSTLTGKGSKEQLDPNKVNAITDAAMERFPGTSISEIRTILRRKCNNESFSKAK